MVVAGYTCCVRTGDEAGRQSGRDRALLYLRETVLTDPDAEGIFLNELELAQKIGVSRTPVREALLLLVADGLVKMVPGRGAYVPPLSGREVRDLMDLRGLLERYAAGRALAAQAVPVVRLRQLLREQVELARSAEDAVAFIERDTAFHQALVDAGGNVALARTYAGLRVRQRRMGVAALHRSVDRQLAVCGEHEQILNALESGTEASVLAAIDNHLELTLQVLMRA